MISETVGLSWRLLPKPTITSPYIFWNGAYSLREGKTWVVKGLEEDGNVFHRVFPRKHYGDDLDTFGLIGDFVADGKRRLPQW